MLRSRDHLGNQTKLFAIPMLPTAQAGAISYSLQLIANSKTAWDRSCSWLYRASWCLDWNRCADVALSQPIMESDARRAIATRGNSKASAFDNSDYSGGRYAYTTRNDDCIVHHLRPFTDTLCEWYWLWSHESYCRTHGRRHAQCNLFGLTCTASHLLSMA